MKINERLSKAQKQSELSPTDMATFFGVGRSTMQTWLIGVIPRECKHSQINARLELLEKAIKTEKYFPVPISVTQYERISYIKRVRDAVSLRVSEARSTK